MAFATDSCNVIGRHNFLAQKLEAKIVSLVSVHCHAHRFGLNYYTAADLYSMVYETAKALTQLWKCFTVFVAIGLPADASDHIEGKRSAVAARMQNKVVVEGGNSESYGSEILPT